MFKKFHILLICFALSITTTLGIQEKGIECGCEHHKHTSEKIKVEKDSKLDIKDCISIGIQNSPIITEYATRLELAKSNVGIAKSSFFPELSLGASIRQEFNSNNMEFLRNFRELPSVNVSLRQLIWDFGKSTSFIKMEEFLKISAEYEFEDSICSTVFNIKMKYYNLLRAKSLLLTEKTRYDIEKNILYQLELNKKNKADISNAKSRLDITQINIINAQDEYENAIEELNNAMFLLDAPQYSIYQTQTFTYKPIEQNIFKNVAFHLNNEIKKDSTIFENPNYTPQKAIEIAYKNSPDIKALEATRDAMAQNLLMAKRDYYPELDLDLGYNYINANKYYNNNFNVGVNLSTSVNPMYQKYNVEGAKAQFKLSDIEIKTFKDNLYFTVKKCLNTVQSSHKNVENAKTSMKTSKDFFENAYRGYFNGEQGQNTLRSSLNIYINSLKEHINTQYEYNIALIKLEIAMHEHLIDYHDDAEHASEFHSGDENSAISKMINCNKKHKVKN